MHFNTEANQILKYYHIHLRHDRKLCPNMFHLLCPRLELYSPNCQILEGKGFQDSTAVPVLELYVH